MTQDDIHKMPASREMDALIAEKVMGYRPEPNVKPYGFGDAWLESYSNRITPAMDVVDKFVSQSDIVEIVNYHIDLWSVKINGFEATADTLPLAICRAALLAVTRVPIDIDQTLVLK